MFFFLQLDNCTLLKFGIWQPIISWWMFCNLQHWVFRNTCFSYYMLHFWLFRHSMVVLWVPSCAQSLEYQICKTKYCWCSIPVQFHDSVSDVSCTAGNGKVATTLAINYHHIATLILPKMQHQLLLTLHWRSFSGWDRESVRIILNIQGSQLLVYEWL
jgi:hypothetical protein